MSDQKTMPINATAIQDTVLSAVDNILAQQSGAKKWGKAEHVHLIASIAADFNCEDPAEKRDFKAILAFKGVGGNDSQFRQWLASKEGGQRIAPAATALMDDYK